jgi:hypothetical protein
VTNLVIFFIAKDAENWLKMSKLGVTGSGINIQLIETEGEIILK